MRTLLVVAIGFFVLAGCSDPANDLTPQQKAALQMLGEHISPDADHERYEAARESLFERIDRSERRGDNALATVHLLAGANQIGCEYERRRKVDGSKKAADWYVEEIKKSDEQIIADWYKPEP